MMLLYFLVVLAAWLLYKCKIKGTFSYWALRGVPGPKTSAPFGSFSDVFLGRKSNIEFIMDLYKEYPNERFIGSQFVNTPMLHIHDPEIIREVFVKQFPDFNGRGMYTGTEEDFLTSNLFNMGGAEWKNLRVKMSPIFTTGKIKYMFNLMKECGVQLDRHVSTQMKAGSGCYSVDIKEVAARFTTDVITSVAFGVQSNCMNNPKSEFRTMSQRAIAPSFRFGVVSVLAFFWPKAMKILGLGFLDKTVTRFFSQTVWEIIEYRERNGVERADMLNLLIKLKNEGYLPSERADEKRAQATEDPIRLTPKEVAAQCVVFLLAGFETSSSTILFTLYLLAKNQHVQEKTVEDIRDSLNRHGGKISYDMLADLPYLDIVINEVMRLYPAVPFLTREALVARKLPTTDVQLEKGMRLLIPVRALHMDPKYWEKPEEFIPERFTKENMAARTPMTYLPFGDGPRICIGMRLALVQIKMALVTILSQCEVQLPPGMSDEMKLSAKTPTPTPENKLLLDFHAKDRGFSRLFE